MVSLISRKFQGIFFKLMKGKFSPYLAFQTAVSLAEYADERDEDNKIKLTDEHLREVMELSKDFKEYLKKLHKADEEKRAAVWKERVAM